AVGLVNRPMVGRDIVPREALVYLRSSEYLVVDVVGLDRPASLSEQVGVGRAGVNRTGRSEEIAAGFLFELAPVLEGGSCERYIGGIFGLCKPDDTRAAVARPAGVRDVEALDAENV